MRWLVVRTEREFFFFRNPRPMSRWSCEDLVYAVMGHSDDAEQLIRFLTKEQS